MTQLSYSLNSEIIICEFLDDCSDVFNVLNLGGGEGEVLNFEKMGKCWIWGLLKIKI